MPCRTGSPWSSPQPATALCTLVAANGGIDSGCMFGPKDVVDPLQHLLGTAAGWAGNPRDDAFCAGVVPERNDGYFEKNALGVYSVNNVTAKRDADGTVTVQFGGCDKAGNGNCLPVSPGWNYLVRLYRPRKELLEGRWTFPAAVPVG